MNKIIVTALSVAILSGVVSAPGADANPRVNKRVNHRQARQQVRLTQGTASGSLTKRETVHLSAAEQKLAANEQRMRASGGQLTAKEHIKLEKQQDKLSKQIYTQKHDTQSR